MFKRLFPVVAAIALLALPLTVSAQFLEAELENVSFADGGRADGSFVYDPETGHVISWTISVSGGDTGAFPITLYSPFQGTSRRTDTGDLQRRITFTNYVSGSDRQLRLTPSSPLENLGEIDLQLDTGGGGAGGIECFNCTPSRQITAGSLFVSEFTPDFELNAGLNGGWFNPPTSGQGIFVDVLPSDNILFVGWFTYDTADALITDDAIFGSPDQRWVTLQGEYIDSTVDADVTITQGGAFDFQSSPDSEFQPSNSPAGTAKVTFFNCGEGVLQYDLDGVGTGAIPLLRLSSDNIELCDLLTSP